MELDIKDAVVDKGVGYLYWYSPKHPMANASGKVYVHRYIAENYYGVKLTKYLHVHHKDENKLNNFPLNLVIMTAKEHGKIHNGADKVENVCPQCGDIFITSKNDNRVFCSTPCARGSKRKFDITQEQLQELVNKYPISHISKILCVSDVAIHKRCKKLGVVKKPAGYFLKKSENKMSTTVFNGKNVNNNTNFLDPQDLRDMALTEHRSSVNTLEALKLQKAELWEKVFFDRLKASRSISSCMEDATQVSDYFQQKFM